MINLRSEEVTAKSKISDRLNWTHKVNEELGKAVEDNHYDHLSPETLREFEALQKLGTIILLLTEIANNFERFAASMTEAKKDMDNLKSNLNRLQNLHQLIAEGFFKEGIESPSSSQDWKKNIREFMARQNISRIIPCISDNQDAQ